VNADTIYVWNEQYEFWAEWGGPIGYKKSSKGWTYCWIESDVHVMGDEALIDFSIFDGSSTKLNTLKLV